MFNGIEVNQIYLFIILVGAIVLLFTEWIRIELTAILKVLVWDNLKIPRGGLDTAQAQSWYFFRSDSI